MFLAFPFTEYDIIFSKSLQSVSVKQKEIVLNLALYLEKKGKNTMSEKKIMEFKITIDRSQISTMEKKGGKVTIIPFG